MLRLTPAQRHTKDRSRRLDGSLWCKRVGHKLHRPATNDEKGDKERLSLLERVEQVDVGPHARPEAELETTEEEYGIVAIVAKRRINGYSFYLVELVGYNELTWEPQQILPWQPVARFELDTIGSAWLYQSTRGCSRPASLPPGRRRRSNRLRGECFIFCLMAFF
jgi:hypothetical protein